jgi:hypothetical protein
MAATESFPFPEVTSIYTGNASPCSDWSNAPVYEPFPFCGVIPISAAKASALRVSGFPPRLAAR